MHSIAAASSVDKDHVASSLEAISGQREKSPVGVERLEIERGEQFEKSLQN